jgi:hypothetical protein
MSTVYRWLKALGYKYSEQGKCYYADAHEREDVVRYRIKFVDRYLNEYEPYMPRWIQVSLDYLKNEQDDQQEMIELHVDTIADDKFSDLHHLIERAEARNNGMGANQSYFRKDKEKKILLAIGQDECIFKQFLMMKKAWQNKNGRFRLRPKDDGRGIMVSAFQCREFGFGFPFFLVYKDKINAFRDGKSYVDISAAKNINGTEKKSDLDEDPFVQFFEYGTADGKQGYWSYDHMILQLEDVLDCLAAVFGSKYEFLFLFDHSCGHDRMRPDALNVFSMNVGFGGTAKHMHDTIIQNDDGYLGPFPRQLKVGDVQSFVFSEDDEGPLMGISIFVSEDKIREGWLNKPKGMKQILYERGFIDVKNLALYSKDGPKDSDGKVIDETFSLKLMINGLTDFVEEKTLLQHMGEAAGRNLGISIMIDRSPKGHPEVAGEGIEYTWACAKFYLRTVPVGKRKTTSASQRFHQSFQSDHPPNDRYRENEEVLPFPSWC